jgi:hypothetical protein
VGISTTVVLSNACSKRKISTLDHLFYLYFISLEIMGFGVWVLGFGVWDLGFGVCLLQQLRRIALFSIAS